MEARASTQRKKRVRHRKVAPHQPNLMRVALLGWLLGMTGAIIFQCIRG